MELGLQKLLGLWAMRTGGSKTCSRILYVRIYIYIYIYYIYIYIEIVDYTYIDC